MLALVAILALSGPKAVPDWGSVSESYRGLARDLKKWGITLAAKAGLATENDDLIPSGLDISSEALSDGKFKISFAAKVGSKETAGFELSTVYEMDENGAAKEAHGAIFAENGGFYGTYKKTKDGEISQTGGVENWLAKIGFRLGSPDEGPLDLGIKLGPLEIGIDPVKYYERLKFAGPGLIKIAADQAAHPAKAAADAAIGGISLSVDAKTLAYAIAEESSPPPEFGRSRIAVSLSGLLKSPPETLGDLNAIEGVMIDGKTQDILLIGHADASRPAIPTERVATLVRAIYSKGMHPFISIDPQGSDFSKPHVPRVGGIPEELRNSSLIASMLTADYAMKRVVFGLKPIDGVDNCVALMERYNAPIGASRFWISPAPLDPGAIRLSSGPEGRYYAIRSDPVIRAEALSTLGSTLSSGNQSETVNSATETGKRISDEVAASMTLGFEKIGREWPESGFAAVRQEIELSNAISLLAARERSDWTQKLLDSFGAIDVPKTETPTSFEALTSAEASVRGLPIHLIGGMETKVDISEPMPGHDPLASTALGEGQSVPNDLSAGGPEGIVPSLQAKVDLFGARKAFENEDWNLAAELGHAATALDPDSAEAEGLYLDIYKRIAEIDSDQKKNYLTELAYAADRFPNSAKVKLLQCEEHLKAAKATPEFLPAKAQEFQAARDLLDAAIAANPSNDELFAARADVEHRLGDDLASAKDWGVAVRLSPSRSDYFFRLAGVLAFGGELDAARDGLDAALIANPANLDALMMRALVKLRLGDKSGALVDAKLAAADGPINWLAYDVLGEVAFENQADELAIVALSAATKLAPRSTVDEMSAANGQATVYPSNIVPISLWDNFVKRSGEGRDPGDDVFGSTAFAKPFDARIPLFKGRAELRLKRLAEAKADFKVALTMLPGMKSEIEALIKQCGP